jgi:2-polyprenyl-3-methyl-5-hydroxy-6-metoxy-1,4-benzoquinol methylase
MLNHQHNTIKAAGANMVEKSQVPADARASPSPATRKMANIQPDCVVWTPEMIERFWNWEMRNAHAFFTAQVSRALVGLFAADLVGRNEIVDYGAGRGDLIADLLNAGYRTAGLEFAVDAVRGMTEKYAGQKNFLGAYNVTEMENLGGRFDAAFLCEVVEHLYDSQLDESLMRIRQLLKPGGILIVTTPNEEDLAMNMIMSPESGRLFHRWQHVRNFSINSLTGKLEGAGFQVIRAGTTNFGAGFNAFNADISAPIRLLRFFAHKVRTALTPNRKQPHLFLVAKH